MPVKHNDWKGLASNISPHRIPAGASVEQVNIGCIQPGVLQVRKGISPVSFTGVTPSGTSDCIAACKFDRPEARWIIYEKADGTIKGIRDGGTASVASSYNVFQPMCFARDRRGFLYGVNGVDRGIFWDGLTSSAQLIGIDPPAAAPTIATPAGGAAGAGDYACAYRYLDLYDIPSSLSTSTSATAVANDGFGWSALSASSQTRVNRVQLFRSTVDLTEPLYLIATIGHNGTVTSTADNGGTTRHTMPAGHNLVVGAVFTMSGGSNASHNVSQTVTAITSTTVDTGLAAAGSGTGGTWQLTGYSGTTGDISSDATISADTNTSVPIFNVNGSLNGRRFVPPPNHKPFMAMFQDRMFYYGNVSYTAGTVAVTSGSATVTGTSTAWTSTMAGRYLYIAGDTKGFLISSASATSITLSLPYTGSFGGSSGLSYSIKPDPDHQRALFWSEADEPESVQTDSASVVQENTGDHDSETGLMPYAASLYLLHERHIYQANFTQQPDVDMTINMIADRGCINNRSWTIAEGVAYLVDALGPYRMQGGSIDTNIPVFIQDYFRDATVDFANSKWWWTEYEPNEKVVRYYIGFTADSSTRPKRALCYSTTTQSWWTEKYQWELGGGARTTISGRTRLVAAGEDDTVYLVSQGTTDGVTSAIRGTVASATPTTLSASGTPFATTNVGASVAIVSGTGKGQIRVITGATTSQLTVATWDTTPSTDSVYLVGAVEWSYKTGLYAWSRKKEEDAKRQIDLTFQPTTNAAQLDVQVFSNHETTATNIQESYDTQRGLVYKGGTADYEINLLSTRDSLSNAPGSQWVVLDDSSTDEYQGDTWMAVRMRGFQGADGIKIYSIEVEGVEA